MNNIKRYINYIKAELIKLLKTKFIHTISITCLIFMLFLFIQHMNQNSELYEPSIKLPFNNASFFLALFASLLNSFWAISLGSYLGAGEISNNSIYTTLHLLGRHKTTVIKYYVLSIVTVVYTIIIVFVGLMVSSICFGFSLDGVQITTLINQFLFTIFETIVFGMLGMTFSKMTSSTTAGNIIGLTFVFGLTLLPSEIFNYIKYISPLFYCSGPLASIFSNINNNLIYINKLNLNSITFNIFILVLFIIVSTCIQYLIDKNKDYK